MKKILVVISMIMFVIYYASAESGSGFLSGTFMTLKDAKSKWGSSEFRASEFTKLNEKAKASMAVNLIEKKLYLKKPMSLVRNELGQPDSYFFSDTIYAYEITPPEENKEQWHLLFIPDDKLQNVKEIKIHKKCCYKSAF